MTLNLDKDGKLLFGITDIIGQSIAALGSKGSGKSNTCATIIEECAIAGLVFCVVDKEGEYWGLKQKFQVMVIGSSPNVDISCDPRHGAAIAEFSLREGISVVLDISEFSEDEGMEFLKGFFDRLWVLATELRKPYQILLEESHQFIPQKGKTIVKDILTKIALLGRKRGLGIILASQRSALVEKNVITQAGIFILHKVVHPADKKLYHDIIPRDRKTIETINSELKPGEGIVVYRDRVDRAQFRLRHTYHGGYTPGLDPSEKPELKNVDETMMERLQAMLRQSAIIPYNDAEALRREIAALKDQVKILEADIAERDQKIAELEKSHTVETMKVARIVMPPTLPVITPVPNGRTDLMVMESPAPVAEAVAEADTETNEDYRSSKAIKLHAGKQRRAFEQLRETVRILPKYHRTMLKFLTNYTGEIKIQSLARELDYSLDTLLSNPPMSLLDRGLIERQKKLSTWYYTGNVESALKGMCPDLDIENLIQELLEVTK